MMTIRSDQRRKLLDLSDKERVYLRRVDETERFVLRVLNDEEVMRKG